MMPPAPSQEDGSGMLTLTEDDRAKLAGEAGPGVAMAMRIVAGMANASDASALLDITAAHIDGCLYHGPTGLRFVTSLVKGGAAVGVQTTLNVSSLDLLHPDLFRGTEGEAAAARELMDAYVALGCLPTWTCAPYQLIERPSFGQHIAWAESNAIVFANSVLGARTERYGDFIDIAAAITGRAPAAGLHLDEARQARVIIDVRDVYDGDEDSDVFFALLGHIIGRDCGTTVPAVIGIDIATEDQLKAMAAASASSGAVGLIHVVGITPEAPDLATAAGSGSLPTIEISAKMLDNAHAELTTAAPGELLRTISVGTPHYSINQITRFAGLLGHRRVAAGVDVYLNTNRAALAQAEEVGLVTRLEAAGVQFVTDTCTYATQILDRGEGVAMTDSAKWAYYAPANLGIDVVFASVEACVESAVKGRIEEPSR